MWAKLNSDEDAIEEIIVKAKDMTVDEINYPKVLFSLWTVAERKAIGIVPVTTTGSHLDTRFYVEKDPAYAIAEDKASVVMTIGVKDADKKLTDTDNVDESDNAILDDHDNQMVTLGLLSITKLKANSDADGYIKGFDWLVQRKVTHDTDIPSAILTYIAAVRTAHASIIDAITACNTMAKYIAIHTNIYNEDHTIKTIAKVNDWPDDYAVKGNRR